MASRTACKSGWWCISSGTTAVIWRRRYARPVRARKANVERSGAMSLFSFSSAASAPSSSAQYAIPHCARAPWLSQRSEPDISRRCAPRSCDRRTSRARRCGRPRTASVRRRRRPHEARPPGAPGSAACGSKRLSPRPTPGRGRCRSGSAFGALRRRSRTPAPRATAIGAMSERRRSSTARSPASG